jgi:hypothetical protein
MTWKLSVSLIAVFLISFLAGCNLTEAERKAIADSAQRGLDAQYGGNPWDTGQSAEPEGRLGFLKSDQISGFNRICVYDVLGSMYTLNVKSTSQCPVTHRFQ